MTPATTFLFRYCGGLMSPSALPLLSTTSTLLVLVVLAGGLGNSNAQGHQYIFDEAQAPYNPFSPPPTRSEQYLSIPFRQEPEGFRHSIGDLQTSDLPAHLQHTLPQYRLQNKPQLVNLQDNTPNNQYFTFHNSGAGGFRTDIDFLKPTTIRPNYSHLFSKARNRGSSQTETFLGQITLQSPPVGDQSQFGSFLDVSNNAFSDGENGNSVAADGSRDAFLNHRTRIVAPDQPAMEKETTRPQIKDYFVNTKGNVFTTNTPFASERSTTATIPEGRSKFRPVTARATPIRQDVLNKPHSPEIFGLNKERIGYVSKGFHNKGVDLEPLLEEPLKKNFGTSNDDEVEVIQSHNDTDAARNEGNSNAKIIPGVQPRNSFENNTHLPDPSTAYYDDSEDTHTNNPNEDTDYYSDELYESHGTDIKNSNNDNDVQNGDDNNQHQNHEQTLPSSSSARQNSSHETETMKPSNKFRDLHKPIEDITEHQLGTITEPTATTNVKKGEQMIHKEPELVISVVTSKTVVNNTVIAPTVQTITEDLKSVTPSSTTVVDNATEAWVVVASVQTSRSVSGARYLPSSIVEQDIRVKLLNEHSNNDDNNDEVDHEEEEEDEEDEKEGVLVTTEEIEPTTTVKPKPSTESLIDKLDSLQSDLSSGVLTGGLGNNIAIIKENLERTDMTTMDITLTTTSSTMTTTTTTSKPYPQVNIRKFSPANRPKTTRRPKPRFGEKKKPFDVNQLQADQPKPADITSLLPPNYKLNASDDRSFKILQELVNRNLKNDTSTSTTTEQSTESQLNVSKKVDIAQFLPPDYKSNDESTTESSILKDIKTADISKFLPPGYKLPNNEDISSTTVSSTESSLRITQETDITKFLPPGYKLRKSDTTTERSFLKNTKADDVAKFLPPGYKLPKNEEATPDQKPSKNTKTDSLSKEKTTESSIFKNTKADDVAKFLPPGYKLPKYKENATPSSIFKNTKADDVAKFLPPGYKLPRTTPKPDSDPGQVNIPSNAQPIDISALLPPGYKSNELNISVAPINLLSPSSTPSGPDMSSTSSKPVKVVFPTRPGSGSRKSTTRTTPKTVNIDMQKPTPMIHKGWPSRATTEFTGWPTPSTTPISVEKLLEAARAAAAASTPTGDGSASTTSTTPSTTTTSTTTTTTPRPTTPGICVDDCDLAGTIKLVDGVKWQPELIDRNTREWQLLANEVQTQLDYVFSSSPDLSRWYRKIRIDGFSEGSVLVDYLVELNDLGRRVDTQEIKQLFHESLDDALTAFGNSKRGGKSLNESLKLEGKLTLGNFIIDPMYTDFLVLPKQTYPAVGYAENDVLLPQWAIAVIVIGLASLLFVIIFGVTVLVNRQKNAKKKNPTPLTEDMLNELNKNHMGGLDNYAADDLYNMEDVWNDRGYEQKLPKKRSNGSIHDNSMSNLYDSWRSEWNGYYYNSYYGNNPGSSHAGSVAPYTGRRRSDYDTNF